MNFPIFFCKRKRKRNDNFVVNIFLFSWEKLESSRKSVTFLLDFPKSPKHLFQTNKNEKKNFSHKLSSYTTTFTPSIQKTIQTTHINSLNTIHPCGFIRSNLTLATDSFPSKVPFSFCFCVSFARFFFASTAPKPPTSSFHHQPPFTVFTFFCQPNTESSSFPFPQL